MEIPFVSAKNLTKSHCYYLQVEFHLPRLPGTDMCEALFSGQEVTMQSAQETELMLLSGSPHHHAQEKSRKGFLYLGVDFLGDDRLEDLGNDRLGKVTLL